MHDAVFTMSGQCGKEITWANQTRVQLDSPDQDLCGSMEGGSRWDYLLEGPKRNGCRMGSRALFHVLILQ